VATHVAGLLREMSPADRYRLLWISRFSVFIGKRRKIAARIFVEFLPELVDPGGSLHQWSSALRRPLIHPGRNAQDIVLS
jgi:hypothetical protein